MVAVLEAAIGKRHCGAITAGDLLKLNRLAHCISYR